MGEKKSVHFQKFKEGLPRVDGKIFVITGTTSGTGFVAARTVLEKGGFEPQISTRYGSLCQAIGGSSIW